MSYDDSGLPDCPMGGKCEGDCEPGCRVEPERHPQCNAPACDCDRWSSRGFCRQAAMHDHDHEPAPGLEQVIPGSGAYVRGLEIDPYYYSCGANYCDDPACIMNRPDHPEYYGPHPEVL